ncbi:ELM2 domain-containing protein [Heracleum sosnowskyi]|uniref:ELM2 domain-containing protein n=1 Tax=Heracleum sosnowskyi TaxID=360622 RepID=A0AAD8J6R5_9APIA|nr:ELM2 domain-containing protein [Heracleum sosnowskyi]
MSKKDEKSGKASFSGVDEAVKGKYVFGKYAEKETLTKLKVLALNHDNPGVTRDSVRPLCDQTLRVREVMSRTDPEFPQRKRKLQQFVKDNLEREAQKLRDEQVEAKFRGHLLRASSASCVHNMTDSNENLHKRILLSSLSSGSLLTSEGNFERPPCASSNMDDSEDWYQSDRMTSLLVDITGSVHGSNPVNPEHIQEPESLHLKDGTNSSNLEEISYDRLPSGSNMVINFHWNQYERMAVPVGHHFQADVPEWCGPSSEVSVNVDYDNLRWLGTKVWPIERQDVTLKSVGRGRPSSCSCASPGSTNCVRHHILEKKCLLQSDIGPLFHIWNFDEMGEEVSKSWTVKEQESFDLIAKRKSSSCNFFQNAMKSLRSKCKKDIVSYYFNVFMPRLMSSQTRSLLKEVDIDIDDVNDVYTLNIRRTHKDRSTSSGSRKDVISYI